MYISIHPESPQQRNMDQAIAVLETGGVIIYPTDTIYGIGCNINESKAIDRVAKIKGIKAEKASFSFICHDFTQLSQYCKPISNDVFKLMKRLLPGPYTFILEANHKVPKMLKNKKKTIGIRIPDNQIIRDLVEQLGSPILSTSVYDKDELIEYTTDPELIYERYENQVDLMIDGGSGGNIPSTVIDCTKGNFEVIRQGLGILD
ncbi:threonylcarbamoyl-AMP synthase [Halosquirtibacter xylanolyticus]|uniref:L-threonylcarbamoyladenylate synthase n=1 Tax=Halosquirtibacter xylanolyticus TaxID=3374599 RepID=UPI00374993DD|nr:threonylcarbamoyl-AMP synthase [Prolixibacteraceae bacterium]